VLVTMSSNTSRKQSSGLASWGEPVYLNRIYELNDGRIGTLKYIGKTFFKPGVEWYGLELSKDFKGKHNGSVQGTSYFNVTKKNQGVFVQIKAFKQQVSGKQGRTAGKVAKKKGALATGKNEYKAAQYEVKDDGGNFLGEKNTAASKGGKVEKKAGSIATGRNKDYDAAKFKSDDGGGDFLGEKNAKASEGGKVEKKKGAIETGRNEDYDAAKFKKDDKGGDFLATKEVVKGSDEKAPKKEGPRDDAAEPAADAPAEEPAAEAAAEEAEA